MASGQYNVDSHDGDEVSALQFLETSLDHSAFSGTSAMQAMNRVGCVIF